MTRPRPITLTLNALFLACLLACGAGGGEGGRPGGGEKKEPPGPGKRVDDKQPAVAKNTGTAPTPEGQRFVREKLAELDGFKDDPRFHDVGFGRGGPYDAWVEAVKNPPGGERFSGPERVAAGDLMNMGFDYLKSKGRETDYTRFARREILATLGEN